MAEDHDVFEIPDLIYDSYNLWSHTASGVPKIKVLKKYIDDSVPQPEMATDAPTSGPGRAKTVQILASSIPEKTCRRIVAAGYNKGNQDPADLQSKDANSTSSHQEPFHINRKNFASLSDMIARIACLRRRVEEFKEPTSIRSLIANSSKPEWLFPAQVEQRSWETCVGGST